MDEARSLTYSINVNADTSQAESNIRNLVGSLGDAGSSNISVSADTSQAESNIRDVASSLDSLSSQNVSVDADTSQAESNLRGLVSSAGEVAGEADSIGSAFRQSFLASIDSGNSFSSSLKSGVGGALDYVKTGANELKEKVVSGAQSIKEGFTHPIETIKSGLGGAIQAAQNKFVDMMRGAEDAADATDELGDSAGNAQDDVRDLGNAAEESGSKFEGFGTILKGIGTAIAAASVAVAGFATASVGVGMDFDKSMSQVAATMGITMEEMNTQVGSTDTSFGHFEGTLRDFAQYMGSNTAFSATEAADALNYMALAGYDADTSMSMLPNVLNLAAAGNIDLASASDMVTDAQSALGLSLDETSQMVDKMAAASSKSNTSVAQLGEAFLTIGGTAKNLAGGTTELSTALGILADNGVKGSEGGTALRNVILSLSAPTDKAAETLANLGVSAFDAEGNMRPLNETFADLNSALGSLTTEEQTQALNTIFNKNDLKSVNALLATSADRWTELGQAIDGSWYSTTSLSESLSDVGLDLTTMQGNLSDLGVSAEAFQEALDLSGGNADLFADMLWEAADAGVEFDDIVGALGGNLDMLGAAFDSTSGAAQAMADTQLDNLAGDITLFKSALEGAQIAISDELTPTLRTFTQFGTESISALTQAFGEGGLSGAMEALGPILSEGLGMIIEMLPSVIDAGMQLLSAVGTGILNNLPLLVSAAAQIVVTLASSIGQSLPTLIPTLVNTVVMIGQTLLDNLPTILDAGMQLISGLADGILNAIPIVVETLPELISQIVGFITDNLPTVLEQGIQIITSLGEGIIGAIPQLVGQLPALVSQIISFLSSNLPTFMAQGMQMISTLASGVLSAIPQVVGVLPGLISQVLNFITSSLPALLQQGIQMVVMLAMGIVNAIPQLISVLPSIITSFVEFIVGNLPVIIQAGVQLIVALAQGLISSLPTLISSAISLVSSIGEAFLSVDWIGLGIQIISSIWDGIKSIGSSLLGGITDLITGGGGDISAEMSAVGTEGANSFTTSLSSGMSGQTFSTESLGIDTSGITSGLETAGTEGAEAFTTSLTDGLTVQAFDAESLGIDTSSLMSSLETAGTDSANALVTSMDTGLSDLSTTLGTVGTEGMTEFSGAVSTGSEEVKTAITTMNTELTTSTQGAFENMRSSAAASMSQMHSDLVSQASATASAIKNAFESISITIPRPRIPQVSVSYTTEGSGEAAVKIPHFSVSYNALGAILTGKTLLGFAGGRAQYGGEAGQEAVLPLDSFYDKLGGMLQDSIGGLAAALEDGPAVSDGAPNGMVQAPSSMDSAPVYDVSFAPVINVTVQGSADDASVDNLKESLYDTVRQLFDEFRQEEIERMALKNQYAFA